MATGFTSGPRYLARPEDWNDRSIGYASWATIVGLMLMILGHLFPLGVLQLGDVVTNGSWHARSEWFRNHPWLSWARLPGDVIFMTGSFAILWQSVLAIVRPRIAPAPRDADGGALRATLFTEVRPGGVPSHA